MFKSLGTDATNIELIEEKLYTVNDEENEVKIRIGLTKTKKYLVIQALYEDDIENSSFEFFQTKLTLKNLKEKSQEFNMESTMDGCYQIIVNAFEGDKVEIKDIANNKYLKLTFNFEIKALDINLLYKNIDTTLIFQNFKVDLDKKEENSNNDNLKENPDNNNLNEIEINLNKNEENKIEEVDKTEEKQDNNEYTQNEEDNNDKGIEINKVNEEEQERISSGEKGLEENNNNININIEKEQENQDDNDKEQIIEKEEVFNEENQINEDMEDNNVENINEEKNIEVIDKEKNSEDDKENNNVDINVKEENNDEENKEENENIEKNIEFDEENKENSKEIQFEKNEIVIEKENNDIKDDNSKENEIIKEENIQLQNDDNNNNEPQNENENEDDTYQKKIEVYNENEEKEEEKKLKEKINELLEKIDSLEKENGLLKKENSTIKEENKNIKNEKKNLENEFNKVKKNEDSLKKENKIIKEENDSLKKENNNLIKENQNLKSENDSFKNKLSRANLTEDKLRKSNREKNDLKIELQKLKNKNNKKDSPEKPINNKKKDIGDIIENIPKRTQTSNLVSNIVGLENIYEEVDNKEEDDKENKNEIINEIKTSNKNGFDKNLNFQSKSPINLKISKTLTDSSYIKFSIDNAFDAFTSLSGEILLVYATKFKSIECFDIIKQKYKKTILNAHNSIILIIRYYCPKHLNKEIILSSSNNPDYCVKIWDIENWSCIFNLNKIYEKGNMLSVCLHFDEYQKESYIFTSSDSGFIKIWGMDGQFIKNINKTENNETYFLDTYYDETELKYFLISGEMKCVKSFELNTHQLFRTYIDNNSFAEHLSAFVYKNMGIVELVECEFYGYVRIWNFHSGNLVKKIEICRRIPLVSMCLWNKNYLLVSCVDYTIKLVDFKNYAFIKSFSGHNNEVCTLKKIIHPMYGECLISQGLFNEQIKMWVND